MWLGRAVWTPVPPPVVSPGTESLRRLCLIPYAPISLNF